MSQKYWLAFSAIEAISASFVLKLYQHFNSIEVAWSATNQDLRQVKGITESQVLKFIDARKSIFPEKCIDFVLKKGIKFFTIEDTCYPKLLLEIKNPPVVLFYKGDFLSLNLNKTLAVVGSRKASISAKNNLQSILKDFRNTDLTIVSGGAKGIDTIAHNIAIENNLKTIAVLGSGFDHIYPASNKKLFEKIIETHGIIMTEFWPSFEPLAWRFPMRNRIVSGLSYGTLIAEAAMKSGALITANLCLEQNRELMCIPGDINNPNTAGIYYLLKNGAAIITETQDILNVLNWDFIPESKTKCENLININLSPIENEIVELLEKDKLSVDEIFNILHTKKLNISDLMVILTTLEVNGIIKMTDGDKYTVSF